MCAQDYVRLKQSENGFSFISNSGSRLENPRDRACFQVWTLISLNWWRKNLKRMWFVLFWFSLFFLFTGLSVALRFVCVCVCCILQPSFWDWQHSPDVVLLPCFVVQFSSPESVAAHSGLVHITGLCWQGADRKKGKESSSGPEKILAEALSARLWVLLSLYLMSFGKTVCPWWWKSIFYSHVWHLC